PAASFTPLADGRALVLGPDAAVSRASIAAFSTRDAAAWPGYGPFLGRASRPVLELLDVPPPDPARLSWRDAAPLARLARRLLALRRDLPRLAAMLLGPARAALESWFESEPLPGPLPPHPLYGRLR